jgi:hypothetical protein
LEREEITDRCEVEHERGVYGELPCDKRMHVALNIAHAHWIFAKGIDTAVDSPTIKTNIEAYAPQNSESGSYVVIH